MAGYGRDAPHPRWPGDARIAISIAVNYEAGAESNVLHGDAASEGALTDTPFPPLAGERTSSSSRPTSSAAAADRRLFEIVQARRIRVSLFGVVMALERNPEVARAFHRPGTRSLRTVPLDRPPRVDEATERASCAARSRASSASPASGRSGG